MLKKMLKFIFLFLFVLNAKASSLRDSDGLTTLHRAAGAGDTALVDRLIKNGADLFALDSKMGVSVLHKAVYSGNEKTVKLLLQNGALINLQSPSNGNTPLHDALYFKLGKDLSVIQVLVEAGASLNIKNRAGLTPIESAKLLGDIDAQKLFEKEINKRFSALGKELMSAVRGDDSKKVRLLIQNENLDLEEEDEQGFTPLLWASREGKVEIVKVLLEKGANPNHLDQWMGATAGHKAAFWGRAEVIKLLVNHGLELNARGKYNGYTALHDAVSQSHEDVVSILLNAGAKTNVKGHDGKTPLDIAKQANAKNLIKLIENQK